MKIFDSIKINDIEVPSKIFLAPINTGFCFEGNPTERLLDFHKRRANDSIGISYVGNIATSKEVTTNAGTGYFNDSLESWKELASIISESGSCPGIQIAGRLSSIKPNRKWRSKKNTDLIMNIQHELVNISHQEIEHQIESFIRSTSTAIDVGFRAVQIHAAHGYFLSKLCSPYLNLRRDKYAWPAMGLVFQEMAAKIRAISNSVILDIRFSILEGLHTKEEELEKKEIFVNSIINAGFDVYSLSYGIYDVSKSLIYPGKSSGHAPHLDIAMNLAQSYPDKTWNIAGNIWDLEEIEKSDLENLTYSIGRPLIADPDFTLKYRSESPSSISRCCYKNKCHYYSRGIDSICCPISPDLPEEGI